VAYVVVVGVVVSLVVVVVGLCGAWRTTKVLLSRCAAAGLLAPPTTRHVRATLVS
jgi:hypothetical protein